MTNKIMIDGVDVRKCDLHYTDSYNEHRCDCMFGVRYCSPKQWSCSFYVNNINEQLQRKTEECEKLKKEIEIEEKLRHKTRDEFNNFINENREVVEGYHNYKQALEEIKEIVKGEPFKYCACGEEILQIIEGVEKR